VVPASGGKDIFTPSASAAQEFFTGYFCFSGIHIISTDGGQFSADLDRYPRAIHSLSTDLCL
jgi:hypothetical protein